MATETILPAIPSPGIDLPKAVGALKEIAEVREARRGDPLDRFVSVRDLLTDDSILQRLDARYYTEAEIAVVGADYVWRDGTKALTANWDAGGFKITAQQLAADIAIGTAPLIITSTTKVTNLNADYVDGQHRTLKINADHTHQSAGAEGGKIDHGLALNNVTSDQHHAQSHNAASHSDISATGAQIDAAVAAAHAAGHTIPSHSDVVDATGAQLEELTGGGDTVLHDHDGIAENTAARHAQAHKDEHDPQDGADKLDTAAPLELASVQAAAVGTSHSLARSDHAHQIQHSIADNHLVTVDGTTNSPVNLDYAKWTASGLEGKTYAQVLVDLSGSAGAAFAWNSQNLTGVGTIGCGAITTSGLFTLNNDIKTDRWENSDTNTYLGVGVCGAGNASGALYNVAFGYQAAYALTSADNIVCIGWRAGRYLTSGIDNLNIGAAAGYYNAGGSRNVCIGPYAGYGISGFDYSYCMLLGRSAGYENKGDYNVSVGANTLRYNQTGVSNVCVGHEAGFGATGQSHSSNTFVGYHAGFAVTTGGDNVLVGYQAGVGLTSGAENVIIGHNAGTVVTDNTKLVLIGHEAGQYLASGGTGNVGIGFRAGRYNQTGDYNTIIGYHAGHGVAANSNSNNTFMGYMAGYAITTGGYNVLVGKGAGQGQTSAANNVAVGEEAAFYNVIGTQNVCVGRRAGQGISTKSYNYCTFVGYRAGGASLDGADSNTAIGHESGLALTTGDDNTFVGRRAGYALTTGGTNICIGSGAGDALTTSSKNIAIGYGALSVETDGINTIAIGYKAAENQVGGGINTVIGLEAARYNVTGTLNTIVGYRAGYGVAANSFSCNTLMGYYAAYGLTTGANNNCFGYQAGQLLTTGAGNICIGYQAGNVLTTGSSNIIIGHDVDPPALDSVSKLNIGDTIKGDLSTGNIGLGSSGSSAYRLYVSVPAGTTLCTGIYSSTLSTGSYNRGATLMALGAGAGNEGVWARATGGTAHNWHFTDYSGNYSDTTAWHDASHPSWKSKIRNVTKKDAEKFYDLLDKLHLKGYYYKQEKKEKNWKAPERFGLLSNDPDLPDFLTSKDRKGMAAGHVAAYLVGVIQHQKGLIAELETRITHLEGR